MKKWFQTWNVRKKTLPGEVDVGGRNAVLRQCAVLMALFVVFHLYTVDRMTILRTWELEFSNINVNNVTSITFDSADMQHPYSFENMAVVEEILSVFDDAVFQKQYPSLNPFHYIFGKGVCVEIKVSKTKGSTDADVYVLGENGSGFYISVNGHTTYYKTNADDKFVVKMLELRDRYDPQ